MIGDIRKFRFWCQKVLPLVYDDSLSYYEILCKVVNYLNKVIEDVNSIPDYIDGVIDEKLSDEHLMELIEAFVGKIEAAISSNNEHDNTNASTDYKVGELLWWFGDLYRVIRDIDAGDTIIAGTNIELVTFEDMFNEFIEGVKSDICGNDDGNSATSTENREAGEWVWLNDVLYVVLSDITEGNAYVFTGENANVRHITVEEMVGANKTAIASEAATRAEADAGLADDIAGLADDIADEASARSTADEGLAGDIADETTARQDADTALGNSITSLGTKISNLKIYNVIDYGAVGDGVTDDTSAIQDAINAATDGIVYFPNGIYLISDTLAVSYYNATLVGQNKNLTKIVRADTMAGDTITANTAGALKVCGMWFYRHLVYDASSITNKLTNESHIKITGGQEVEIIDCMFWDMPYHITIESSSLVRIRDCNFKGSMWDSTDANRQEGIAAIRIGQNSYCQLINIESCYLGGGYIKEGASVTVGSATETIDLNIGSLYGIVAYCCEGLVVDGCYIGGFNSAGIQFLPTQNILSQIRIVNNFLDGCFDAGINFISTDGTKKAFDVVIEGNHFNGQVCSKNGIAVVNATNNPCIDRAIISNNVFENHLCASIWLCAALGLVIRNNQFTSYNCKNDNASNPNYNSGIYAGYSGGKISCMGNSYGGGINGTNVANYCVNGIYYGATGFGVANNETDFGISGTLITNSD